MAIEFSLSHPDKKGAVQYKPITPGMFVDLMVGKTFTAGSSFTSDLSNRVDGLNISFTDGTSLQISQDGMKTQVSLFRS